VTLGQGCKDTLRSLLRGKAHNTILNKGAATTGCITDNPKVAKFLGK